MLKFYRCCLLTLGLLVPWDRLRSQVTEESPDALCWAQRELGTATGTGIAHRWCFTKAKQSYASEKPFPIVLEKSVEQSVCVSSMATTQQIHLPGLLTQHKAGGQEGFPEVEPRLTERQASPLWAKRERDHSLMFLFLLYPTSPSPNHCKGHPFLAKCKVSPLEQEACLGHLVS